MQQQFNCPSCKKPYQQSNLPRLLTMCGHSYCQKCIKYFIVPYHLKGKQYKFKVTCPQDQQYAELLSNKPSQFPKNIALLQKTSKKRRSKTMMPFDERLISGKNINNMSISRIRDSNNSDIDIEGNQFLDMIKSKNILSSKKIIQDAEHEDQRQNINPNNICLLHQKPLEIICIDHAERICVNCALFGQHKGHNFKNVHQIEKDSQKVRQQLNRLVSLKKQLEAKKLNKTIIKQVNDDLQFKTNKMKSEITHFCQQMNIKVKELQKIKLAEVDRMKISVLNRLKNIDSIKSQPRYDTWQKATEQFIQKMQKHSIQERVCLLYRKLDRMDDRNIEQLFQQGFRITAEIKERKPNCFNEIQSLIQSFQVIIEEKIIKRLQNSIGVQSLQSKQKSLVDEVLLQASQSQKNIFYSNFNEVSATFCQHEAEQSLLQQSFNRDQNPKMEKQYSVKIFKRVEKSSLYDPMQSTISQGTKSCFGIAKSLRKKKNTDFMPNYTPKNLNNSSSIHKVSMLKASSTKYQKVLQGLKSNTLQVIDLTGAELGCEIIEQLGQKYIKNSRAKTVKLTRNKLTDECMQKLLPNIENVCVLNMSQNQLTEKSINLLLDNIQNLPNLKNIVLSQNKIIQRKIKSKIEKLKLHGLTVTL